MADILASACEPAPSSAPAYGNVDLLANAAVVELVAKFLEQKPAVTAGWNGNARLTLNHANRGNRIVSYGSADLATCVRCRKPTRARLAKFMAGNMRRLTRAGQLLCNPRLKNPG